MKLLTAAEVAEILQIGTSKAYQLIRIMNKELEDQGYLTIRGRVNERYFRKRFFGVQEHE